MRKYQPIWEALKTNKIVEVELPCWELYTSAQLTLQFNTIRRCVSKEKYLDWNYKSKYPDALISAELNLDRGTITFHLDPDRRDLNKLFD